MKVALFWALELWYSGHIKSRGLYVLKGLFEMKKTHLTKHESKLWIFTV